MNYKEYKERKKNPPKCDCGIKMNLNQEMVFGLFGCIHKKTLKTIGGKKH